MRFLPVPVRLPSVAFQFIILHAASLLRLDGEIA